MLRSDWHNRFITSREALLFQGFPIIKELSYGVPACSFACEKDCDGEPTCAEMEDMDAWRHATADTQRTSRIGQAGNAMHAECIAITIAFILSRGNMSVDDLNNCGMYGRLVPRSANTSNLASGSSTGSSSQDRNRGRGLSRSLLAVAAMIAGSGSSRPPG